MPGFDMAEQTAYDELVTAINRFLAGSYNVAYLMGWCYAHFQPPDDATDDDPAIQLWNFVMLNLRVYGRCALDRWALDESLRLLTQSFAEEGYGCLTPITTSRCFIEMIQTDRAPSRNASIWSEWEA